jgi:polyphosphate kinase
MRPHAAPGFPADHYINRELSWLEFNARVLEEARDPANPMLERLKFAAIFSSNLDEFFEVRVAGLQQQLYAGLEAQDYAVDGLDPTQQLAAVEKRAHELVAEQDRLLHDEIFPGLAQGGIERVRIDQLNADERAFADSLFARNVYPVLTPLAIDPGHPFPHVHNKSLNVALVIENVQTHEQMFGVVQVPAVLDRVVVLPGGTAERVRFLLLEELIASHLDELFGGFRVVGRTFFRVTRNTDLTINEDDAEDLLQTIEENLRQRLRGDAVRLEILADADARFVQMLVEALDLAERDVYRVGGPVDASALAALLKLEGFRPLRDEPLVPRVPAPFASGTNPFDVIRAQDVLVHHPYESFGPVLEFIERAADDPQVLAIKQTLYRSSGASPIISALARAAQNRKQVTALVELKARFDEENNIVWARELEQAGVHVVYGVVGLKTHCKAALVVRKEADGIRRYVHLSTGNYNPTTARIYTDIGLFTANKDFGEDVSEMFNLLTGYSQRRKWRRLVVAPADLLERVLELIERERRNAAAGRRARIIVKMNALVEPSVIDALYRASQAGVTIDLVIRGICCLRPGLAGVSETIRVTSIVDKFLEHSRVFYFENDGKPDVFLASADWMPRNFFRRIEVMFPVEDPRLKARIVEEILPTVLADSVKARTGRADGTYQRLPPPTDRLPVRSQAALQNLARESAREALTPPAAREGVDERRGQRRTNARRRPRAPLRPSDGSS